MLQVIQGGKSATPGRRSQPDVGEWAFELIRVRELVENTAGQLKASGKAICIETHGWRKYCIVLVDERHTSRMETCCFSDPMQALNYLYSLAGKFKGYEVDKRSGRHLTGPEADRFFSVAR